MALRLNANASWSGWGSLASGLSKRAPTHHPASQQRLQLREIAGVEI